MAVKLLVDKIRFARGHEMDLLLIVLSLTGYQILSSYLTRWKSNYNPICVLVVVQSLPQTSPPPHQWNYKFAFTKSINSQLIIECEQSEQIWIGWSHYGTRHPTIKPEPASIKNSQLLNL